MRRQSLHERMLLAIWPVLLIPMIPLVSLALIAVNGGATMRPAPLITLCEVGAGVTVQLVGWRGEAAITTLTDADGNYFFTAQTQEGFAANAMRLGDGIWPVYLPEENFAQGGRLEAYQIMQPDLQYGRVPALGTAGIAEYMALVNSVVVTNTWETIYSNPPTNTLAIGSQLASSESNWTEADYEFLASERERLLGSFWPCYEMVRKPGAAVSYSANVVMESGLDLYAETTWGEVRSASGVISATNVVLSPGMERPIGLRIDYDPLQVAPPLAFFAGVTETLRLGPGNLQMVGDLRWRENSEYRTVGCGSGDDDRGIPERTLKFGVGSCMDDYVQPLGAATLIGMDYGETVITGTVTITPTFALQSVTCSLAVVSAGARYCSVAVNGGSFAVSVWDGSFAPSVAPARVFWSGLGVQ